MSNKKLGSLFEQQFAEMLHEKGYWVHMVQQNKFGQPADIIAVKDEKALLIDCKVCETGYFNLSRIEENQELAMKHWMKCHNRLPWFALRDSNDEVYMISFDSLMMKRKDGVVRVCVHDQVPFEHWVSRFNVY